MSFPTTFLDQTGKLVKWINLFRAYQVSNLLASGTGVDEILTQYETQRFLVTNVEQQWLNQAAQMASWGQTLKSTFDTTIQNLQLIMNAANNSVTTVLPLFVGYLAANSATVQANTITAPSLSVGGSNIGDGKFIASKKNVIPSLGYVDDQRIISETVQLTCTKDRFSGAVAGGEQFSIIGYPGASPGSTTVFSSTILGNGVGPPITVADNNNIIVNGAFTSFNGTTPNNWTVNSGAALISKETTNVHAGTGALKYAGDGSTTSAQIIQTIGTSGTNVVNTYTVYAIGVWLRKGGTVTSGSNLQVAVSGTGFTTVNLFNADPSTLTTSYVFYSQFFSILGSYPANLAVTINWTSANTAGASAVIYTDNFVLIKPNAYGSFGSTQVAIFRGDVDFLVGDTFSMVTANNNAGVWQSAYGLIYNLQLPSAASSPTISDSLAT
jgi:hypothetical protein